jgi:hypothetical protein
MKASEYHVLWDKISQELVQGIISGRPLMGNIDSIIVGHFGSRQKWSFNVEGGILILHIELGEELESKETWKFKLIN